MSPFINTLLNIILNKYFINSRCVLFMYSDTMQFEYNNVIPILNVNIKRNYLNHELIFHNHGCQDIFIIHEKAAVIFQRFEEAILFNVTKERYMKRKYVVVTTKMEIRRFLRVGSLKYVKDLLLIEETDCMLYTHSYFGQKFNELVYLDTWWPKNFSFKENEGLFPDKTNNFWGRTFRLDSVLFQPNTVLRNGKYEGTEIGPMLEFCEKYNLTPVVTVVDEIDYGQIYKNGSADGLSKLIVDNVGEVSFGAIGTWIDYYRYSEFGKPMVRSGITCIVPLPGVALGWQVPFLSFSMEMWLLTILTIIVCSLFYYWFRMNLAKSRRVKIQKLRLCYFSCIDILAMHLLQPIRIPKSYIIKILLGFVLFNVSYLTNAYSSGLYSYLAFPRVKKTIDSVQDMADEELIWAGGTDSWITTIYYYEEPKFRTIIKNFVWGDDSLMRNLSLKNKYGFVIERLPYGHYGVQTYLKQDVIENYRIMKDDIYWDYWIYMYRKNSVLQDMLDFFILRYIQAGLPAYKETKVVLEHMDNRIQEAIYFNTHRNHRNVVKLEWEHVEGAFTILFSGYIAGCIVFLVEMVLYRYKLMEVKFF